MAPPPVDMHASRVTHDCILLRTSGSEQFVFTDSGIAWTSKFGSKTQNTAFTNIS
jgi:hypothetical protein